MALALDPEEIETQVGMNDTLGEDLAGLLTARKDEILAMDGWDGMGRQAFNDLFEDVNLQLQEALNAEIQRVNQLMRDCKDNMLEADELNAAGLGGSQY